MFGTHGLMDSAYNLNSTGNVEMDKEVRLHADSIRNASLSSVADLFLAIFLWFFYLLSVSVLWTHSISAALAAIIVFPPFIVSWLGYLRHELWHNYIPIVPNRFFFNMVSNMLFSNPKIINFAHTTHHRHLHTEGDLEFFCKDYSKNSFKRKAQFLFELFFGNAAWEINFMARFIKSPQFSFWKQFMSVVIRIVMLLVVCYSVEFLYPGAGVPAIFVYVLSIWVGAVVTRQDQWIEHLGVLHPKDNLKNRILKTRSLPNTHWSNRIWNMINHNDSRSHYFHHAYPQINLRDVTEIPLPKEVPTTTIPQYLKILWNHWKTL